MMADPAPPIVDPNIEQTRRAALVAAPLKRFQEMSGLEQTGIMDDATKAQFATAIRDVLSGLIESGQDSLVLEHQSKRYKIMKDGSIHTAKDANTFNDTANGNVTDPSNPLAAVIWFKALPKLEDELLSGEGREELLNQRLLNISEAQRRIAAKMVAVTGGDADDIISKVRESGSVGDAQRKLKELLGPGKDNVIDHFSFYLWNLAMAENSAQNPDFNDLLRDSEDYRRAAAANDVLFGLGFGKAIDTLGDRSGVDVTKLPRVYGRLFDSNELYKQVAAEYDAKGREIGDYNAVIDGGLFGEPGTLVDKNYVYQKAVERFEAAAGQAGIALKDVSKAMFEGRFNPPLEDLDMVYKGLSMNNDNFRSAEWNRRYGAIRDIGAITTVTTAGREDDANFKQRELHTNGEGILARAEQRRSQQIDTATYSAYDYFKERDAGSGDFSFRRDYRNLSNRYAEELTLKDAGHYSPDAKKIEQSALANVPKPGEAAPVAEPVADTAEEFVAAGVTQTQRPVPAAPGGGARP